MIYINLNLLYHLDKDFFGKVNHFVRDGNLRNNRSINNRGIKCALVEHAISIRVLDQASLRPDGKEIKEG